MEEDRPETTRTRGILETWVGQSDSVCHYCHTVNVFYSHLCNLSPDGGFIASESVHSSQKVPLSFFRALLNRRKVRVINLG